MAEEEVNTPEARARKRAKGFTDLMWHTGAFVVVNVMLWILDLVTGPEGVQWAFWVTLFWGIGLAFHGLAYLVDDRGVEERKYQKFLAEEQDRQTGDP